MSINYQILKKRYLNLFDYNEEYFNSIMTDVLFAYSEIAEILEKNKINNVLEVGSGTGVLINVLKDNFKNIKFTGLDPNQSGFHNYEKISKKLLQNNDSINVIKSPIGKFETKEKYDLIFSFNVFEHIESQSEYISKTNELLAVNGKNIIFAPNYDFPYEPHFILPIIINKKITHTLFSRIIKDHETKTKEEGLWNALNFTGKKGIEKILTANNCKYFFDYGIKKRMLDRVINDKAFRKRQGFAAILAIISRFLFLDKILFDFFKIPFPYMKLTIVK
jgi:SAM-dependent methyltransferase